MNDLPQAPIEQTYIDFNQFRIATLFINNATKGKKDTNQLIQTSTSLDLGHSSLIKAKTRKQDTKKA